MSVVDAEGGNNNNAPASVFIEYPNTPNAGPGGPDLRKGDVSLGSTVPAHVRYPPPRNILQWNWLNRSDQTIIGFQHPMGAILDMVLEFVLEDSTTVNGPLTPNAVTAPGQLYYVPLDNGAGGNYWVPENLLNTVGLT